jgi:hypothetical protein
MLFRETVTVHCEDQEKQRNVLCGLNAYVLMLIPLQTYNYFIHSVNGFASRLPVCQLILDRQLGGSCITKREVELIIGSLLNEIQRISISKVS